MNVLWAHSISGITRLRNGAGLRVLNLSRGLVQSGINVYLVGISDGDADRMVNQTYGDELVAARFISGHSQLHYSYSYTAKSETSFNHRRRIAFRLLFGYPPLVNALLKPFQATARREFRELLHEKQIELVILGDRRLMFLIDEVGNVPVLTDFIDSEYLAARRSLGLMIGARQWNSVPSELQRVIWAYLEERHYGRKAKLNMLASPVDQQSIAQVTGRPQSSVALLNGVDVCAEPVSAKKIPGRIIFSGNMNFLPNHHSALWFIDKVLPHVVKENPGARLVVAGANPQAQLLARKSANLEIPGFVEDMTREIAQSELAVTPMIAGGGFKNKVLEALMAGTFVASTRMGIEFLPEIFSKELLVCDEPAELARQIVEYLRAPAEYRTRIEKLQRVIQTEFSWESRAGELKQILEVVMSSSQASS